MAFQLGTLDLVCSQSELGRIPDGKVLINTINAHSFNTAQRDRAFAEALSTIGDGESGTGNGEGCVKRLVPDGAGIVKACRWLKAKSQPRERIAGWDLFVFEMERLERRGEELKADGGKRFKVMFLGSSEKVLSLISRRAAADYPNLETVTYSPPYKPEFSDEDSRAMVRAVNEACPDLLWIGMTAPKQEKWAYRHWKELDIHCHVGTVGAVFDFYAGTARRAPLWWQRHSLEWLHRLLTEPGRMWRRYVAGIPLFLWYVLRERLLSSPHGWKKV